MKHFYTDIEGRFNFQDVYNSAVFEAPKGANFLEIGCWQGRSTAYLGVQALNSGKGITIHCIDSFEWLNEQFDSSDQLYKVFKGNIAPLDNIILHRGKSAEMVDEVKDIEFDFIYIDGNHSYEGVKADINNYYPLLKVGGIMAGHDYGRKYRDLRRVVAEEFGFDYKTILTSWIHRKPL